MVIDKKKLVPSALSYTDARLDVYRTDEKNTSKSDKSNGTQNTNTSDTESTGFHYHTGKILETKKYLDISDIDFGDDYTGFVGESRVVLPYRKDDLLWIYRGVQCRLFVTRIIEPNTSKSEAFHGFIKDVAINESDIEIQLTSYSSLLEKKLNVSYNQLPRSQVIANIIKEAGLIPMVDATGLNDELIDWTSVSTTGGTSSNTGGVSGDGSMTEDQINQLASKVRYVHMGSNHDPQKGFKNLTQDYKGDCYDITAGLYYAFNFKAGIPARDIVAHSNTSNSGTHHCCQIQKNGKWVFPAFYDHCTTNLKVNSPMKSGKIDVAREPPNSDGKIPGYCASSSKKWP